MAKYLCANISMGSVSMLFVIFSAKTVCFLLKAY